MLVKINSLNQRIEKKDLEKFTRSLYIHRQKDRRLKNKGEKQMRNQKTKITKEDFAAYARIQRSGVTNMLDIKVVSKLSGLSKEKIFCIQENYRNVSKRFKFIRD
ncbi:hypothetical protein ES705_02898 [subsurface metagenome]